MATSVRTTAGSIVDVARDRHITLLAAGFAYYAFVSLVPLVALLLVASAILGGEAFADRLIAQVEGFLSASGQQVFRRVLTAEAGRTGFGIASGVLVVWSALKVFRGLDTAFDEVYDVADDDGFLDHVRDGAISLVAVGFAVGLMVGVAVAIGFADAVGLPYANVIGGLALLVGLVLAFLPLYYVMPPVEMTVRRAIPGAVVATVGWVVLQAGFQVYAAQAGNYAAYGVLGAILLFVTWLYLAGVLVLLGAIVNYVLAIGASSVSPREV